MQKPTLNKVLFWVGVSVLTEVLISAVKHESAREKYCHSSEAAFTVLQNTVTAALEEKQPGVLKGWGLEDSRELSKCRHEIKAYADLDQGLKKPTRVHYTAVLSFTPLETWQMEQFSTDSDP